MLAPQKNRLPRTAKSPPRRNWLEDRGVWRGKADCRFQDYDFQPFFIMPTNHVKWGGKRSLFSVNKMPWTFELVPPSNNSKCQFTYSYRVISRCASISSTYLCLSVGPSHFLSFSSTFSLFLQLSHFFLNFPSFSSTFSVFPQLFQFFLNIFSLKNGTNL